MGKYLTAAGFKRPSFTELLVETQNNFKAAFGPDFDLTPESPNGYLINSMALQLDAAWSAVQEVYDSLNPNGSDGVGLDNAMAFGGLTRKPATRLHGKVMLFSDGESVEVPEGTVALRNRGGLRLVSTGDATVSSSSANVVRFTATGSGSVTGTFEFGFGEFSVSGASPSAALADLAFKVQQHANVVTATDSVLVLVPVGGDTMSVVDYPSWVTSEVGVGVEFEAESTGEETAERGEVDSLEEPIDGITRVENIDPLVAGAGIEGDTDARKRLISHNRHGKDVATDAAIESHLLNFVSGVTYAKVTSNRGMTASASGQPPKSFEAVVVGGTNTDVATGIMESMSAGIEPYGSIEVGVVDEQGDEQVIRFSRPSTKYLWVDVVYSRYLEQTLPDGVDAAMSAALVELAQKEMGIGTDVLPDRFKQAVYGTTTAISRAVVKVALSDTPDTRPSTSAFTEDDIAVAGNTIAVLALSRISTRLA